MPLVELLGMIYRPYRYDFVNYPPPIAKSNMVGALNSPEFTRRAYFEYYDFWVISPTNTQPVCSSEMNLKYFYRDFPPEVVARVEQLYCVTDLADLAKKQQLAEEMFAETLPRVEEVFFTNQIGLL
jgi:hypothetical protein